MLYDELQFVPRVGTQLLNFKQKNQYLWNCSCPICGDMSSNGKKQKARLYIYRPPNANQLNVKCHKCGYSVSFRTFLKEKFSDLHRELSLLKYVNPLVIHTNDEYIPKPSNEEELKDSVLDSLRQCSKLSDTHPVAKYLARRQIPRDKWYLLYYTLRFKEYCNSIIPGKFATLEHDHPRLIIPYFDIHGCVYTFQGRTFGKDEPKYITINLKNTDRIYGLDRIDYAKKIYAVEGPIDSLFLPNCVAVSGSNFDCNSIRSLKSVITIIPDNEPRSSSIVKLVKKHINLGYKVCMLPHSIKTKDINEHIQSGFTVKELVDIIDRYTYQGPAAMIRFSQWVLFENECFLS